MITTRLYMDCRRVNEAHPLAPVKIVITKLGVRSLIPLNISLLPSQWDHKTQQVIAHPLKQYLNTSLGEYKLLVDSILFRMKSAGELQGLSSSEIRQRVVAEMFPEQHPKTTFLSHFNSVVAVRSTGTQRIFNATLSRLRAYLGKKLDSLTFEEMNVAWLRGFDAFMAETSPSRNARNIHLRNIRTVFNDAITEELITCYPFRKFKLIDERTRKRALTGEQLHRLFSAEVAPYEQRYLDCFKIIFMLCGINIVDLCNLRSLSPEGRVEYTRAKTHRLYSIKVEPECAELLEKYRGQDWLLSYLDSCNGYRTFYTRLSMRLRLLKEHLGLPGLSTYWARHSWATVAASLDIPKETIAAALGHGGNSVTDIYIDFDQKKVDEANRRVLDWVLYGKK